MVRTELLDTSATNLAEIRMDIVLGYGPKIYN